jgi:hypothetical protein
MAKFAREPEDNAPAKSSSDNTLLILIVVAAGVLLVCGGLAGVGFLFTARTQVQQDVMRAEEARAMADAERARMEAESNRAKIEDARRAMDDAQTKKLANPELFKHLDEAMRQSLRDASREMVKNAKRLIADGHHEPAQSILGQARGLLEQLVTAKTDDAEGRKDLTECLDLIASSYRATKNIALAEEAEAKAKELRDKK